MDPNQMAPVPESSIGAPPQTETPNNFAPTPVSPAGPMSQEEMKANLQDMMSKIDSKYQVLNSGKFTLDNEMQANQGSLLQQIFDFFQSMGVDPSDTAAVQEFLNKIKRENPELSQQLEVLLQRALGVDVPPDATGTPTDFPNLTNMNINKNESPQQNL